MSRGFAGPEWEHGREATKSDALTDGIMAAIGVGNSVMISMPPVISASPCQMYDDREGISYPRM
jgi:hypothetical protein